MAGVNRWVLRSAATALVIGGFWLGARAASRQFLYPAQGMPAAPTSPTVERHALVARDGVPVHAIELTAPPGARTVVHFHNNRETVESCVGFAEALRAHGLGVLLVEYRGYGHSPGADPTEAGLYADAEAALDMLAARGVSPDRIVLSGASLGTGIATEMAHRGRGGRLVLVTPYTSIPDLVTDVVPFVPASVLVADHYETVAKAPRIAMPTLVVHGLDDEIVPFWMGSKLSSTFPNATLLEVPGGRHGDLFARDGARIIDAIVALSG